MVPTPAPGPEAPLDMLAACHTRVEKQCQTLLNLAAYLPDHGVDQQVREAVEAVTRYFDRAAKHHHEDEELNLFAALLGAVAGSDATCLRTLMQELSGEHRVLEADWITLRQSLAAWALLADGVVPSFETALVTDFVGAYRRHARKEDQELFPVAARLLDEAVPRRLGASMRQRRDTAA